MPVKRNAPHPTTATTSIIRCFPAPFFVYNYIYADSPAPAPPPSFRWFYSYFYFYFQSF